MEVGPPRGKGELRGPGLAISKHSASGEGGPLGLQEHGFTGGAIPTVATAPEASGLPGSSASLSANSTCPMTHLPLSSLGDLLPRKEAAGLVDARLQSQAQF